MSQSNTPSTQRGEPGAEPALREHPAEAADKAQAVHESAEDTVSSPGGFKNDPDDSTNPNEAIERHRRKVRP